MHVLIVQEDQNLARIWAAHLERQGCDVTCVQSQGEAIHVLRLRDVEIIVLDLVLAEGSALSIADYASYRRPETKIVCVTNTTFFSDGSIFQHVPNACAFMASTAPVSDISAVVEHYGRQGTPGPVEGPLNGAAVEPVF